MGICFMWCDDDSETKSDKITTELHLISSKRSILLSKYFYLHLKSQFKNDTMHVDEFGQLLLSKHL